ncbi:MAG TPA: TIGR02281 family clan AA aspartic protease [Oculatellaceae cyanobacterium]|jgi:clan AA aspartic protease (TIGR02281 family)
MQSAHALRKFLALAFIWGSLASLGGSGFANGLETLETQAVGDYQAGVLAYRNGDYVRSISHFRRLLTVNPENTNAHYYLGLSFDNLNMAPQAVKEYQYVVANGREEKIVAYANKRLQALRAQMPATLTADKNQEIAMMAAGTPLPSKAYTGSAAQIAVPLKNNRNALMVDAVLSQNGKRGIGTFIIDTGATYTSISQEMAEQMGLDLRNCEKVYITTANGRIEVPKVTIEKLSVNGLEARNVEATVIQIRPNSSFSGLLGLSFIRQFIVTIDPQGGQLIFQKN